MPDSWVLTDCAQTHCLADSPQGYVCTEQPNHDGWHRTELDGELLATWPQEDLYDQ
jgi:hypothetical protein